MIIKNKKFLIYGCGKTGVSLAKFIINHGGSVAVYDKKLKSPPQSMEMLKIENRCETNKKQLFSEIDIVILSPGVSVNDEIVQYAISKKVPVMSEMDFSFANLAGTKIGITASCGKSTTTKMIYEMLKSEYADVRIGGNYGTPICDLCENSTAETISVLEISSFMLEQSKNFHIDIAVFGNISKNHLDRHKTMKKYQQSKCKISKNMSAPDVIIIPKGENAIKTQMLKNAKKHHPPKVLEFKKLVNGKENNIKNSESENCVTETWVKVFGNQLIRRDEFKIAGDHNLENLLLASMASKTLNVSDSNIIKTASEFQPLPHRFEKVAVESEITYINDSKSTSGKSAEISLALINSPAVLLVGGSDKNDDFFDFFMKIKANPNVIKTIIYGAVKSKLEYFAKSAGYFNTETCENFKSSFEKGKSLCVSGSSLILIPACPSFDEFENFEKRGECFKMLAEETAENAVNPKMLIRGER